MHSTRKAAPLLKTGLGLAALAALGTAAPRAAEAQLVYFTDRGTFTTANPGLTTETFEEGTVVPGLAQNGPIDKSTSNANFSPGQIANGLRLDFPGPSGDQYYLNTAYNAGNGTKVVTTNLSDSSLNFLFYNNNVDAVGFDLGGNDSGGNYTVNVYGQGDQLLGTTTVTDPGLGHFGFLGVSAPSLITRINVSSPVFETVDNVSFGGAAPTDVPEPSQTASLGLGALGVLGLMARARRRRTAA